MPRLGRNKVILLSLESTRRFYESPDLKKTKQYFAIKMKRLLFKINFLLLG